MLSSMACPTEQIRLSMLYWSDEMGKDPSVRMGTPRLYEKCNKCWPKCYWASLSSPHPCHPISATRVVRPQMHCWGEAHSLETWRAYNYPHVCAVYWVLYRLARHYSPPLTSRGEWRWYLEQAGRTALAMWKFGGRGTSQWGLMVCLLIC